MMDTQEITDSNTRWDRSSKTEETYHRRRQTPTYFSQVRRRQRVSRWDTDDEDDKLWKNSNFTPQQIQTNPDIAPVFFSGCSIPGVATFEYNHNAPENDIQSQWERSYDDGFSEDYFASRSIDINISSPENSQCNREANGFPMDYATSCDMDISHDQNSAAAGHPERILALDVKKQDDVSEKVTKRRMKFSSFYLYPPTRARARPPALPERPQGCKTIFVDGLPKRVDKDIIKELFELYGTIQDIRIKSSKIPEMLSCYVLFETEDSVACAVSIDNYRLKIKDKDERGYMGRLTVRWSEAYVPEYDIEKRMEFPSCCLYPLNRVRAPPPTPSERPLGCKAVSVDGLPEKIDKDILREIFSKFGVIKRISLKVSRIRHKYFAEIQFESKKSADSAISLNNYKMKIKDKDAEDYTGRLTVQYSSHCIDQAEYDRESRALFYSTQKRQKRPVSPPHTPKYTAPAGVILGDSLRNEKTLMTFQEDVGILTEWFRKGECTKTNRCQFLSWVHSCVAHARKLQIEMKKEEDILQGEIDKLEIKKKVVAAKGQDALLGYNETDKVFKAVQLQKVWDHLTKNQRKTIENCMKECEKEKSDINDKLLDFRVEEDMALSDSDKESCILIEKNENVSTVDQIGNSATVEKDNVGTVDKIRNQAAADKNESVDTVDKIKSVGTVEKIENLATVKENEMAITLEKDGNSDMAVKDLNPDTVVENINTFILDEYISNEQNKIHQKEMDLLRNQLSALKREIDDYKHNNIILQKKLLRCLQSDEDTPGGKKVEIYDISGDLNGRHSTAESCNHLHITEYDVQLVAIISTFLSTRPEGASIDNICSHLEDINRTVKIMTLERLLQKFSHIFKQENHNSLKRWKFIGNSFSN